MSATCVQCGATLRDGAQFCGGCGAAHVVVEDASAVARYRELVAGFLADGTLSPDEAQQLEAVRQRLGLSLSTHERLLSELRTKAPPSTSAPAKLRLMVDVSTLRFFEVDARCMLRFELNNESDLALARIELHAEILGGERLAPLALTSIFPGKSDVASLWLVPKIAGFSELRGVLHAVDLLGEHSFHRFDGFQFRVGSGRETSRVSVVNIDQSSARVVDNSRSSFAPSDSSNTGLVADAEWRPLPLRSIDATQAADLVPALINIVPPPPPQPQPQPDAPVHFKIKTERADYEVTSRLAQGELAGLFTGRRSDGSEVVVKLVDDRMDNDLMQAEVRALAILHAEDSPQRKHLPIVLDQFEVADGRLGTVLDALDGLDLNAVRARLPGGIPQVHLIWILRRCLSVLGWAHSHGVIHGNVDPAHILLRARDHNAWLIDWCYSIIDPARTGQGFRCINEVYSAPEVAERKPPLPSSDLYSLGKCMFFVAGGDPVALTLPDSIDERIARFLRFFVLESPLTRARDAWALYAEVDQLREEVFGPHQFTELNL